MWLINIWWLINDEIEDKETVINLLKIIVKDLVIFYKYWKNINKYLIKITNK